MYWTGSTCSSLNSNSAACSATSQCRTDIGLSCLSNVCSCASAYYWSGSSCG